MMHHMRQATWIQVQSIVRDLYWSRQDIPGHMFSNLLQLGLRFSDMGLAFLNDDPLSSAALGSANSELSATHDLEDIVVQRCGEYWFRSMHQGHISLFLDELLPVQPLLLSVTLYTLCANFTSLPLTGVQCCRFSLNFA